MPHYLFAWVGMTDLRAAAGDPEAGSGPIGQAVESRVFDDVHLLDNLPDGEAASFGRWLAGRVGARVHVHRAPLSSPMHFGEIYRACRDALARVNLEVAGPIERTFHLSPGTPAMAAVWILLAKTQFPAILINSSREHGVKTAEVPFDIAAEFLPDLLRQPDERLQQLSAGPTPESPAFEQIMHRSPTMRRVIARARRVALRNLPVLIEGESGTGKELLARAIHRASPRSVRPFMPVNCGALPDSLVESLLFGHERGAFTGAGRAHEGVFVQADGGTLFLDEIGELPLAVQVKLLRALQEGEVTPLGASSSVDVDVRLIAATNRNLIEDVAAGRFREDLFYRVGVAILKLPPLREREGDLRLLIRALLSEINEQSAKEPGWEPRTLSVGAERALLGHPWPGNVRELQNTLRRAAVWSEAAKITETEIRDAILPAARPCGQGDVLGHPLGDGFSLQELMDTVARHYLERAMDEAEGNKTQAARLLGLPSYQTLTNWLGRYGVRESR